MTRLVTDQLPLVAGAPKGMAKIRELILSLAVRGKLVEQDPVDAPANQLLLRLNPNWQPEGEWPFNLPIGWEWTRFAELLDFQGGGQPPKSQFSDYPKQDYVQLVQIRDLGEKPQPVYVKRESVSKFCSSADILVGRYGASVGKVFWGKEGAYNVALVKMVDQHGAYEKRFLYLLLRSPLGQSYFSGISRSAQDGFNKGDIARCPLPVVSIAEQRRIVAKVDELMALCDRLEAQQADAEAAHAQLVQVLLASLTQARDAADFRASWQQLAEHFHTLFTTEESVDALERSAIALALQGRMNTASADDNHASAFIASAKEEKRHRDALSGRKRITPEQTQDQSIDGGLPAGWMSCRVDEVADCLDYIRRPINKVEREGRHGNVPYYGANGPVGWIDEHLFDEDLVLVVEDETFIGRTKPFSYVVTGKSWVNNHAHVLRPLGGMSAEYLNLCLHRYDFVPLTSGTTGRRKLTQAGLNAAMFPIAPLSEQRRIVARVGELTALCDQLRQGIKRASQHHEHLASVLVEQAVA